MLYFLKMMGKLLKWGVAVLILISPAYAQGINVMKQANPDGSQTLFNHVPQAVSRGLVAKLSHANSNQKLDLRIILPSKDQAGLDKFLKDLYNPQSPNYHKYITPQQFNQQFGASTVDSALVIKRLQSLGLTVKSQSQNGFMIRVTGPVSTVESAFNETINNYKGLDGKIFYAPAVDPVIPLQIAGKINAIVGMDNIKRFYPHYHRTKLLGVKKAKGSFVNPPAPTVLSAAVKLNGPHLSNASVSPHVGPAAPTGVTAVPSDISALLYWNTSSSATSYNIYRSTSPTGPFTIVPTVDGNGNPLTITTTNFTDAYYTDSSINCVGSNPCGLSNGTPYYYYVEAVNGQGVGDSAVVSATPFAFLGIFGSLGPVDIADAYNLNSLTSSSPSIIGTGQILGIYELDTYTANDISTFEVQYNLPNVTLTQVCTDEPNNNVPCPGEAPGDAIDEVALDIELAVAVAPGVSSIRVYEVPNQNSPDYITGEALDEWDTIVADISNDIHNNLSYPNVISSSWSLDEFDGGYSSAIDGELENLAALGVTVFVAAGDAGAWGNCDNGTNPPNCTFTQSGDTGPELTVDYPASSQYATGVGISLLTVNSPGTIGESYSSEEASLFGGGGVSTAVAMPAWQLTAATSYYNTTSHAFGSENFRNVPDVVLNADPATEYGIYVTDPTFGAGWYAFGGSSCATPIWAAYISLVNQGRAALGETPIGFLNPTIYQIALSSQYSSDFHDIRTGLNDSYPNFAGNDYYPAGTGFDDASGLGSFNGANLYSDLLGAAVPTGLNATPGNNQVVLNWTASGGDVSFNIKRSTTSTGPYTTISTFGAVGHSPYTDSTAVNSTTYYYVISAVNSAGVEGVNTSEVSAMPAAIPVSLTVNASPSSADGSVTCGDSSTACTSPIDEGTSITFFANPNSGFALSSWTVTGSAAGAGCSGTAGTCAVTIAAATTVTANFVVTHSVTVAASPSLDGTVTCGNSSTACISPINNNTSVTFYGNPNLGYTLSSWTVTGSTPGAGCSSGVAGTCTVAISAVTTVTANFIVTPVVAPSALNATLLGARVGGKIIYGGVALTWVQSTSGGIIHNKIYRSIAAGPYSLLATISPATSYKDTNVTKGTMYNYKVTAFNSSGSESAYSNLKVVNY